MKSEHQIQNEIRIAISQAGHTVFRANVGKVQMKDGRWFDTGLPAGFSDLFGVRADGKAFFLEIKKHNGIVKEKQRLFLEVMKSKGALTGVARSVSDALKILGEE